MGKHLTPKPEQASEKTNTVQLDLYSLDKVSKVSLYSEIADPNTRETMEKIVETICLVHPVSKIERIVENEQAKSSSDYKVIMQLKPEALSKDKLTEQGLIDALKEKNKQYQDLLLFLILNAKGIDQKYIKLARKNLLGYSNSELLKHQKPENLGQDLVELYHYIERDLGITEQQIKGRTKNSEVCRARAIAAFVLRKKHMLSYPVIGKELDKNHATIIMSERKFQGNLDSEAYEQMDIKQIFEHAKDNYKK